MKRIILLVLAAALAVASPAFGQLKTRESVNLGGLYGWFPDKRQDLQAMVDKFLADAGDVAVDGKPIAIIAPHAGYKYSGATAAYAYKTLVGKTYDRVIILAPSHYAGFAGGHVGDWDAYSTPLSSSPLDKIACRRLLQTGIVSTQPRVEAEEHSLQNQLPFLETVAPDAKIVPVIIGGPQTDDNLRKLGDAIRSIATPDTLYVVSSDFTHYGARYYYTPFTDNLKENIRKGDQAAIDLICANDLKGFRAFMAKRDAPTICGAEPIAVLLRALDGRKDIRGRLLKYSSSAEHYGDYSNSVSYAAVVLTKIAGAVEAPLPVTTIVDKGPEGKAPEATPEKVSEEDQRLLLKMAREQLVKVVKEKKAVDSRDYAADLDKKLLSQGAAFVTLKNGDELRGCIGDIFPTKPIFMSVLQNTINAARRDPRFLDNPITEAELPKIDIEITVLTPFKLVPSYTDIVIGRHGTYIEKRGRSAVFLPQVAPEQGWDRDTMLRELCMKAGLPAGAYKEPDCKFWVFEGQVFSESEMKAKEKDKEK